MKMIKKIKDYLSYSDDPADFSYRMVLLTAIIWGIETIISIVAQIFIKYPHLMPIADALVIFMGLMALLDAICVLWLIIGVLRGKNDD